MKEIKPKHKEFALAYLKGNFVASKAYAEVYDKDIERDGALCRSAASALLAREEILHFINEKLESEHLTVSETLSVLRFLAIQKTDLSASLGACKLILQVNEKVTDKLEITQKNYTAKWS